MNFKSILVALFVAPLALSAAPKTEPVDYVNPYIGSISQQHDAYLSHSWGIHP